jgi:hypothetical protein
MQEPTNSGAIIVTSISEPNAVLRSLAEGASKHGLPFIVVGDAKTPDFAIKGCSYYNITSQIATGFEYAKLCPTNSYARKNIGYLLALREGVDWVAETDDDNFPRESFWLPRTKQVSGMRVTSDQNHSVEWCNVYDFFSKDAFVYPRGFPIEFARNQHKSSKSTGAWEGFSPIQQGLADGNPDVDAIYRMLYSLPISFEARSPVALGERVYCPFNSQNTTFFREAFPLLYLPAHCSFRMTDIWRSFVAQRILQSCGWSLTFHQATVWQERNEHDLLCDFEQEIPGYLNNRRIVETLAALELKSLSLVDKMALCYDALIKLRVVGAEERTLLNAWLNDLNALGYCRS